MSSVVPFSNAVAPASAAAPQKPVPEASQTLLSRPRLLQHLAEQAGHRICTLIGPTGSGKTVLLAHYFHLHASAQPLAWLHLTGNLHTPTEFFHQLSSAIRQRYPAFNGYTGLQQPDENRQTGFALSTFINGLKQLPGALHIIIDNFEWLDDAHWKPLVQQLLELSPAQVKWILSGRHATSIDTHRWALRDELGQLNQPQLFFSATETSELLQQGGCQSDAEQAQRIFQYTRGWPAGVKLAQVLLAQSASQSTPDMFGKHVFATLCNGVLAKLPHALQQFLLHTAMLENFSAPLCDYLLQTTRSSEFIRQLCDNALFIEALPTQSGAQHTASSQPVSFHYHALFRDHLLQQFRQLPAAQRDRSISRACTWLVENGAREQACLLARDHGERVFFEELLHQSLCAWIKDGYAEPVCYWVRELGEARLMAQPETHFIWAWALGMSGQQQAAENLILRSQSLQQPGSGWKDLFLNAQRRSEIEMAALYAVMLLFRGELTDEHLEQLARLQKLPVTSRDVRASIDNIVAQQALYQCDFRTTRQRASQALLQLQANMHIFGQSLGHYLLANTSYLNNDIRNAIITCDAYLANIPPLETHNAHALMEGFRAWLLYQGDQPLQAEILMENLLFNCQPGYSIDLQRYLTVPLIRLRIRRGDFVAARTLTEQLDALAQASGSAIFAAHATFEKIRLAYAKGNSSELQQLAMQNSLDDKVRLALDTSRPMQWEARECWVLAGIILHMQHEQFDKARALAQQLLHLSVDYGYPIRFLSLNMCIAYLDLCTGQISSAYRRLNDTLTQAEATGMLFGLIDDLPGMDDMIRLALSHQRILNPEHVRKFRSLGILDLPSLHAQPALENLTEQEREVAEQVAQGINLHDVADALHLSLPTVQWHLDNIAYQLDLVPNVPGGQLAARLRQLQIR